tara:strand:+ start:499 stop:765 length:267 start_codon:yes stop_codon:yes gene_type:complete
MSQNKKRQFSSSSSPLNTKDVELNLEFLKLNKPIAYQNILNEIEKEMLKIHRENLVKEAKILSQKYGPIKRLKSSAKGRKTRKKKSTR